MGLRNVAVVLWTFFTLSSASLFTLRTGVPPPPNWVLKGDSNAVGASQHWDRVTEVIIALRQRNMDVLENTLLEVSDPRNAHYGQHLTQTQIAALIGLDDSEMVKMTTWCAQMGLHIKEIGGTRDFITVETTPRRLESIFGFRYGLYEETSGAQVLRSVDNYNIPSDVNHLVDFIVGVQGFPYKKKKSVTFKRGSQGSVVLPSDVIKRYAVPEPSSMLVANNSQAVVEIDMDWFNTADLEQFFTTYLPNLKDEKVRAVYGYNDGSTDEPSGEANLDIQWIMAMGQYVPSFVYSYNDTNDPTTEDAFIVWLDQVSSQTEPSLVQSVSYGEYGGQYPMHQLVRINNEFIKAGTRGITILFASGDDGVGCTANCKRFEFPFPSSPYITLVGSTSFGATEQGADFSSGGFSDDWPMPAYQKEAVETYLSSDPSIPPFSFFNRSGRALPDVSAIGVDVAVILSGEITPLSGTSASSPIFGAFIALMNNLRMQQGKSPLGFVNPFLYQTAANHPAAFYDVTTGQTNSYSCCPGFNCFKGWDAVTGLGTPVVNEFFKVVKNLP